MPVFCEHGAGFDLILLLDANLRKRIDDTTVMLGDPSRGESLFQKRTWTDQVAPDT